MQSVFISSANIDSKRWQSAFSDACVFVDYPPGQVSVDTNTLVWLVMDGPWRAHLHECKAAGAKIVALTLKETAAEARELISLGCSGYLHALAAPEQLERVKTAVEYDGLWLGRDLMTALLFEPASSTKPEYSQAKSKLSGREFAVAEAVAEGLSNKEVAHRLHITERTVKAHLSACFEKLNVRDRMQLTLQLRPDR
ncbi:response regulator transcription factor [Gilvimarinus agarilyticus]|uniref:response regulator transcription factor n=1 Tax=unclassified Gilvimarinus TaxID=2642066 RepID=UPI001C09E64E|nr:MULTISPECIES: response regulator transcription factor [unclassified Gilvimarinus]MBU2886835.1 response regulator transcription factor [Gilvimarinus agarilyticus]MDO6571499.1 response regulator transcription factor [Gilvimarinus sp. 2_MG-2023]MDO6747320.1 response regulator transcription factor [Gilvimarinus sp. 1_MG-2023]